MNKNILTAAWEYYDYVKGKVMQPECPFVVSRIAYGSDSMLSVATMNGKFLAYIVEDELRDEKVPGETAIEPGLKELKFTRSPKFTPLYGHLMIEIVTPRHTKAYFHPGITEKDTEGCPLVGDEFIKTPAGEYEIKRGHSREFYLNIFYPEVAEYMNLCLESGSKPYVLFTTGPVDLKVQP